MNNYLPACHDLPVRIRELDERRRDLASKFTGLSSDMLDLIVLLEAQCTGLGHCAFCGRYGFSDLSELVVDHDHETGNVRGFLCRSCNSTEWRRYGNRSRRDVDAWCRYREHPPTQMFGLRIPYSTRVLGWWRRAYDQITDHEVAELLEQIRAQKV